MDAHASYPVHISGYNLNYYVGEKHILKDLTVCFQPNELVAVMGPSGGGKTTLIDVLAGQAWAGRTEGTVLFCDNLLNPRELKTHVNYVPQDDILYPGLTPREHLLYTAELRLPRSMSMEDKELRVDSILDALSIQECADTIVGGIEIRGISGGQKKRCSVGMELVTNPSGLFLDEPTTGLDSKTAEDLIRYLADLAHGGRTIISTIHQPSPQVFSLFDRLLFLSAGSVVYDGPVRNVDPYFASIGHALPADEDPADFIMEVVSEGGAEGGAALTTSWRKHRPVFQCQWMREREAQLPELVEAALRRGMGDTAPSYPTTATQQFATLYTRSFTNYARDIWGLPFRVGMSAMGGVMLGTCFINLNHSQAEVQLKEAMFSMLVALCVYDQILGSSTVFPGERPVVMREYRNGYYRLFSYYASRTVMLITTQIPYIFAMCTMVWGFCDLRPGAGYFARLYLTCVLGAMNATIVGMLLGVFVADATIANIIIPPIGIFTTMVNGFFVRPSNMPVYIKAWTFVNYGSYTFENLVLNEFHATALDACTSVDPATCPFGCDPRSCNATDPRSTEYAFDGDTALQVLDYTGDHYWRNTGATVATLVFWYFVTYLALRWRVSRKQ